MLVLAILIRPCSPKAWPDSPLVQEPFVLGPRSSTALERTTVNERRVAELARWCSRRIAS